MPHPVEEQSHLGTGLESSHGPLSYNQQALWFTSKLDPIAYNLAYGFRLRGALDPELLKRALSLLVARHPVLRTTFSDTERGPLRVLLLACHHLSLDGGSLGLLLQDLQRSYGAVASGREADLGPPPTREYDEFVQWQSQWLASAEAERARTWWREQLAGCTPVLNLPTDRPRPVRQSFRQHTHVTTLSEPLAQALAALAKGEGTSVYALLLAAFQALLHRHSGQEDLLVGVPSSGRSQEWHSRVVGYLVNTLAVRSRASAEVSFRSFLKDTARTLREALAHGSYPFPKVIEELKPPRDAGRSPLVQATFTQMPRHRLDASAEPAPFDFERLTASNVGLAGDLSVHVHTTRDSGTQFLWAVNADVFEPATVERLAARYVTLLESLLTGLDQPVAALCMLPPEEAHQLVVEWNETATDVESEVCLHELFSRQVERTPDAVALLFEREALTYRELDTRANHVAHHLRRLGVGPEVRVGLCMERSPELMVGLLGVLKAGGAYVPLDPAYPAERLAFMVSDARLTALVTQRSLAERLPASDAARLFIGTGGEDLTGPCAAPDSSVGPGNAAYVIYTSGSTGRPKGVTVEHRSVSNLLATQPRVFPLGPGDTVRQFASVSFDMAVQEVFSALVSWTCAGRG